MNEWYRALAFQVNTVSPLPEIHGSSHLRCKTLKGGATETRNTSLKIFGNMQKEGVE
jgi:hypothetical protein